MLAANLINPIPMLSGEPEMAVAVHVVRMPITVWRVVRSDQAEVVITYGEEHKGPQHINILWHQAGHYGEQPRALHVVGGGGGRMSAERLCGIRRGI